MVGKFDANVDMERGGTPGRTILTRLCMCPLIVGGGSSETVMRCGIWGYHSRQRAGVSCSIPSQLCGSWYLPRFLLRGVIEADKHGLLYGPGDALGLPIYYGEAVKFDGMPCCVSMIINGEGALRCSLYLSPKVLSVSPMYSILHPRMSHLYL